MIDDELELTDVLSKLELLHQLRDRLDELVDDEFRDAITDSIVRGNTYFKNDSDLVH